MFFVEYGVLSLCSQLYLILVIPSMYFRAETALLFVCSTLFAIICLASTLVLHVYCFGVSRMRLSVIFSGNQREFDEGHIGSVDVVGFPEFGRIVFIGAGRYGQDLARLVEGGEGEACVDAF